jgi:hypothetical protein
MHVVMPMSGVGQRFIDANYNYSKPLIVVDGKPIIEHVCDLFPGEEKFPLKPVANVAGFIRRQSY